MSDWDDSENVEPRESNFRERETPETESGETTDAEDGVLGTTSSVHDKSKICEASTSHRSHCLTCTCSQSLPNGKNKYSHILVNNYPSYYVSKSS